MITPIPARANHHSGDYFSSPMPPAPNTDAEREMAVRNVERNCTSAADLVTLLDVLQLTDVATRMRSDADRPR